MCCFIVGNDLMVRVPLDEFDAVLRRHHVRPMDFTGKPLRGFVYVSPPGFSTTASLRAWLTRGERAAMQPAPAPPPTSLNHGQPYARFLRRRGCVGRLTQNPAR